MERKQRGEKRQSGLGRGKERRGIARFPLPVCIYYRELDTRFLFSFLRGRATPDKGWKTFTPSRGGTWLLGVVCRDDDPAFDDHGSHRLAGET